MKTERAIELLNRISDSQFDGPHGDERREALSMAVRALEGDGDTIYRQDAIDALAKWFYDVFGIKESDGTATIFKRLRELPSAQPERILYANISDAEFEKWLYEHGICNPNIHESIPCDALPLLIDNAISELPSAQPEKRTDKRTETHACDLISRKMAIGAIEEMQMPIMRSEFSGEQFVFTGMARALQAIKDLPSAQPQRKKGRWIWWYEEEFTEHATEYTPHCKCSECGRECAPSVATYSNFCRNCGAYMRDENDAIS